MALSNMLREPRREITESVVGIAVVGGILGPLCWADYRLAVAWEISAGYSSNGAAYMPWLAAMIVLFMAGLVGLGVLSILIVAAHALGDRICDALQRRGVHLRPKQRY